MAWGKIDDESFAEAEKMIGVPLRRNEWRWFEEASRDAIRHYCTGYGEDNPLYLDLEYGKKSVWKGTIAPPTFLYAIDATTVGPKFPGVQWIYAACDFVWGDVIRLGDKFTVTSRLTRNERKNTSFAKLWVMQHGEIDYLRDGKLLARAYNQIARTPRGDNLVAATGGKMKYETRQPHKYTPEEIEKIEQEVLAERPRGADTLYWEDVKVGDAVTPVVKGPLTGTDVVGWYACVHGTQPYGGTLGLVTKYRRRHNDYHFNKSTGTKDSAGRGHLEVQTGVDVGMGGAYDIGPQRISWFQHMLTNWMGDAAFLRQMKVEVRRPNLLGDTCWVRGKVTAKEQDGKNWAVKIETEAVNQRGERTAWGTATVYLPSREHGAVSLPVPVV